LIIGSVDNLVKLVKDYKTMIDYLIPIGTQ